MLQIKQKDAKYPVVCKKIIYDSNFADKRDITDGKNFRGNPHTNLHWRLKVNNSMAKNIFFLFSL